MSRSRRSRGRRRPHHGPPDLLVMVLALVGIIAVALVYTFLFTTG